MSVPSNRVDSDSDSDSSLEKNKLQCNTDYRSFCGSGKGLASSALISPDGTITVSIDLNRPLPELPVGHAARVVEEFGVDASDWHNFPQMNIVIMIVGSRGDVQPYVALGQRLIKDGHRVRIASHETFRTFVNEQGLEFFDIGGNPADLMSYMVKNPGLMPGMESLTNGDIPRKRKMLREMIEGCWKACHGPCPKTGKTFAADAIISNPPTFAHIHCAEALGIPLLLSFTMPWTPTTAFPHPLVNVDHTNAEPGLTNYLTYPLAELMTWQGIGDIINKFRKRQLGLHSLSMCSGPGLADTLKVPWTYCMSPALVPKPKDWSNHIDVSGFYFLDLGSKYTPADDLAAFLAGGPAPLYIGFGSVVIEDPVAMSKTIFEATAQAGVRALVSAGWGGLGGVNVPSHIFILGNVPHDWLFANHRVTAVIHHGGAGTTSAGLYNGLPTLVVPFFGDQGFWGSMIAKAGAGPEPIPPRKLNVKRLTAAIQYLISDEAKVGAERMKESIRNDDGVNKGAESFYRHLPLKNMRCDLDTKRLAVWWSTEHCLKLSAFAAEVLINAKELDVNRLECHRPKEYDSRKPATDPLTGGGSAIFWTVTHYYTGIAEIFYSPIRGVIHTTTAIPKGIMKIISSVQEGFHNLPKRYGSDIRTEEKVTDFSSGLRVGGTGLVNGYYDGITGLITEPIKGGKRGGFTGALKGSARSFANASVMPAAGIVGVVSHPLQGMWKSLKPDRCAAWETKIRVTRMKDGMDEFKASSVHDRDKILKRWKEAKAGTQQRREGMVQMAKRAMEQAPSIRRQETADAMNVLSRSMTTGPSPIGKSSSSIVTSPPSYEPGTYNATTGMKDMKKDFSSLQAEEYERMFLRDIEMAIKMSQSESDVASSSSTSDEDWDEEFRRSLERAKALSLSDT